MWVSNCAWNTQIQLWHPMYEYVLHAVTCVCLSTSSKELGGKSTRLSCNALESLTRLTWVQPCCKCPHVHMYIHCMNLCIWVWKQTKYSTRVISTSTSKRRLTASSCISRKHVQLCFCFVFCSVRNSSCCFCSDLLKTSKILGD